MIDVANSTAFHEPIRHDFQTSRGLYHDPTEQIAAIEHALQ